MSLEMTVVDQLEHLHRALALMEEVGADEPVKQFSLEIKHLEGGIRDGYWGPHTRFVDTILISRKKGINWGKPAKPIPGNRKPWACRIRAWWSRRKQS